MQANAIVGKALSLDVRFPVLSRGRSHIEVSRVAHP